MRITLKWKITTILVLVGLVPAAIVGWFAYNANDDYRSKQILIVRKTAECDQLPRRQSFCSRTPRRSKRCSREQPLPDAEREPDPGT